MGLIAGDIIGISGDIIGLAHGSTDAIGLMAGDIIGSVEPMGAVVIMGASLAIGVTDMPGAIEPIGSVDIMGPALIAGLGQGSMDAAGDIIGSTDAPGDASWARARPPPARTREAASRTLAERGPRISRLRTCLDPQAQGRPADIVVSRSGRVKAQRGWRVLHPGDDRRLGLTGRFGPCHEMLTPDVRYRGVACRMPSDIGRTQEEPS